MVPRPFTIEPPLDSEANLRPGDTFPLRMTIFGQRTAALPLHVQGSRRPESGARPRHQAPVRFRLHEAWAHHPSPGAQPVLQAESSAGDAARFVRVPTCRSVHADVLAHSAVW